MMGGDDETLLTLRGKYWACITWRMYSVFSYMLVWRWTNITGTICIGYQWL